MLIGYNPDGRAYVARYEIGDLVRLRMDETGDGAMGRIGDWGCVIGIERGVAGLLDIQLAGYSEGKNSALQRLLGIPRKIVVPCDAFGIPIPLTEHAGLRAIEANFSRQVNKGR
ncbi:hypothetical protein SAMN02745194_04829 [Roseomonas rosea]|uniref:Uncharacterized protein n=1 Tax=Muricoccus roseus TaxID=198092 RepID=A0A1M6S453_9PROT|nr:hypothetical protein [Roseomonas rosea]SHK39429.1 hypothetical protein SAMN02745194_04829 [Roseomonas rosea]